MMKELSNRSDLTSRLIFGTVAIALYGGLILLEFHAPPGQGDQSATSGAIEVLGLVLFVVWIASNGLLVVNGNAVISTLACVFFWWMAFHLSQPHYTGLDAVLAAEDDQIDGYVFLPVLGFINLCFLLAAHTIVYLTVLNPSDESPGGNTV